MTNCIFFFACGGLTCTSLPYWRLFTDTFLSLLVRMCPYWHWLASTGVFYPWYVFVPNGICLLFDMTNVTFFCMMVTAPHCSSIFNYFRHFFCQIRDNLAEPASYNSRGSDIVSNCGLQAFSSQKIGTCSWSTSICRYILAFLLFELEEVLKVRFAYRKQRCWVILCCLRPWSTPVLCSCFLWSFTWSHHFLVAETFLI